MTPRAEAMVVLVCSGCGKQLEVDGPEWEWACPQHGDPYHEFGDRDEHGRRRVEVIPATDFERALDVLERLVGAAPHYEASDEARTILRAAGRLDG